MSIPLHIQMIDCPHTYAREMAAWRDEEAKKRHEQYEKDRPLRELERERREERRKALEARIQANPRWHAWTQRAREAERAWGQRLWRIKVYWKHAATDSFQSPYRVNLDDLLSAEYAAWRVFREAELRALELEPPAI